MKNNEKFYITIQEDRAKRNRGVFMYEKLGENISKVDNPKNTIFSVDSVYEEGNII